MPLDDPTGTVVPGSDARNISAVLINGEPRNGNGQVLGVDLPHCARGCVPPADMLDTSAA
ncbi:hypothetical protein ACFWU3_36010 [Streptomyces sp. NPDC058685]|uniref:hypothetical protein n=1 Tax=Streptomyces sp. NPDC058685 TaxID=3346598 RepID=UPI00365DB8CA